jgi:hypothetical protein
VIDHVTLLSPARIEGRVARDNSTSIFGPDKILWFQRIRQRMGFAERKAEGIRARRFGRQSIQCPGCLFLPVTIWRVLQSYWPFTLTQQTFRRHGLHFFAPQNGATESGNAGIEIVVGERFPGVTVFGLSLAHGGHQTMKHSISIYR